MTQQFLTPNEIAQKAGVSYQTVLAHIKAGKLNALSFGNNYAVPIDDATRYIATGGAEISQEVVERLEWQLATVKRLLAERARGQQA